MAETADGGDGVAVVETADGGDGVAVVETADGGDGVAVVETLPPVERACPAAKRSKDLSSE